MLMEVRNQLRVSFLSIKYALMREMLNKVTFVTNILFMILNNASFIIQWIILFSLKDDVGGYTLKTVILLWGLTASIFGLSRFIFYKAFSLSDTINTGKLDSYLVQPKNVLISVITSDISVSSIGDLLYGYIMLIIYGFTISRFILFTYFMIAGSLLAASISIILSSLSFWFQKTDFLATTANGLMVSFSTYPDGIFKGLIKVLLYTIIPIGISTYIPIRVITNFNIYSLLLVTFVDILFITLAFIVFYRGLKRYSSSNLMIAKI